MRQCSGAAPCLGGAVAAQSDPPARLQASRLCRLPSAARVLTGIESLVGAAINASARKPQTVAAAQALADALLASE